MTIYLVTKNSGKIMVAREVFDRYQIQVLPAEKEYPEIQANTSAEIAKFTALQVARELGGAAIREDHSLFIRSLGIPGPYTNFMEQKIPASTLLQILKLFPDRQGYFEIAACYAEPGGTVQAFSYQVPIEFADEERGTFQSGWNRIIRLKGETRTLAEYPEAERVQVWNKNYEQIAKYLQQKNVTTGAQ